MSREPHMQRQTHATAAKPVAWKTRAQLKLGCALCCCCCSLQKYTSGVRFLSDDVLVFLIVAKSYGLKLSLIHI